MTGSEQSGASHGPDERGVAIPDQHWAHDAFDPWRAYHPFTAREPISPRAYRYAAEAIDKCGDVDRLDRVSRALCWRYAADAALNELRRRIQAKRPLLGTHGVPVGIETTK